MPDPECWHCGARKSQKISIGTDLYEYWGFDFEDNVPPEWLGGVVVMMMMMIMICLMCFDFHLNPTCYFDSGAFMLYIQCSIFIENPNRRE